MPHQNPHVLDELDELDDELHGLFAQATSHIVPRHDLAASVQRRLAEGGTVRRTAERRSPPLAAALSAFCVVALLAGVFVWFGPAGAHRGGGGSPTPAPGTRAAASTVTPLPLSVTSVDLSVTPASIAGTACGSRASLTYTATFHLPAHTGGGTIRFDYTLDNGRSQTPGTVTVSPGATSAIFTFTSSGTLTADHTYPGPAMVMVTSPNHLISQAVMPSGACEAPVASGMGIPAPSQTPVTSGTPTPTAPFQVTSISMAVTPTSITGMRCGTSLTVTYTATFHLAPNGRGGAIQFFYTVNNGRGSNPASITVPPGRTTAQYVFTWSGVLPADHTYPEPGGVTVQSPNTTSSPLLGPSGTCS